MRKRTKLMWQDLLLAAVIAGLLVFLIRPAVLRNREEQRELARMEEIYRQAEELYRRGKFEDAGDLFRSIDYHYAHVNEYNVLCDAHRFYAKGDLYRAKYALDRDIYSFLEGEDKKAFEAFKETVDSEYAAYEARQDEEWWEQWKRQLANQQQQQGTGTCAAAPYIGMSEWRINDTELGRYSQVRITQNGRDLETWEVHVYYWYKDGKTLYFATCEKGAVVNVGDYRDHPKSHSGNRVDVTPYPDVSDFSNPEDFYDFYSEDFDGYYDAEDFYYEHGGR